jgi:hypothetical protein
LRRGTFQKGQRTGHRISNIIKGLFYSFHHRQKAYFEPRA